jgi:hypothetical protein
MLKTRRKWCREAVHEVLATPPGMLWKLPAGDFVDIAVSVLRPSYIGHLLRKIPIN